MSAREQEYDELEPEFDALESDEYEFPEESEQSFTDAENPFSESEEMELAYELLAVTDEQELDLFLGKLFKKVGRGLKKIGRKALRPLGGMLKGIAKKALPFVGGALGSFIPIPGVGTAVGSALGGALSRALEMELEGMDPEDQEFEMAKRFVNIAGTAARRAAMGSPMTDPRSLAKSAVVSAIQRYAPGIARKSGSASLAPIESGNGGRWIRRGRKIVLLGV